MADPKDEELIAKVRALNGNAAAEELAWQLTHLRTEMNASETAEEPKRRGGGG